MAKIGYARVSTRDQDHAIQEARLRAAGCEIVRAEKVSGKSRVGRDELAAILEFIRPGDELVVVKLDRLGRSTRDVLNLVHELEAPVLRARARCTKQDLSATEITKALGMGRAHMESEPIRMVDFLTALQSAHRAASATQPFRLEWVRAIRQKAAFATLCLFRCEQPLGQRWE